MDFYYFNSSPPCHSIMMTAKAVGVEMNYKMFDYPAGDHLKPEFLKINPQHSLPTIVDDGFVLWESRAIMVYLAEKYGKTDKLYPKCPNKRGLINQRLFFDMGLYQKFADYYYPQVMAKAPANPEIFKKMEEALEFLNTFLDGQQYAAGENLTLADIALSTTIFCYDAAKYDLSKYPNVEKWYKYIITVIPGYELNEKGRADYKKYFVDF